MVCDFLVRWSLDCEAFFVAADPRHRVRTSELASGVGDSVSSLVLPHVHATSVVGWEGTLCFCGVATRNSACRPACKRGRVFGVIRGALARCGRGFWLFREPFFLLGTLMSLP